MATRVAFIDLDSLSGIIAWLQGEYTALADVWSTYQRSCMVLSCHTMKPDIMNGIFGRYMQSANLIGCKRAEAVVLV